MIEANINLKNLLERMYAQELISGIRLEEIKEGLSNFIRPRTLAWYLQALIAIGAWWATLFFLIFFFLIGLFRQSESFLIFGIIGILAATLLRRFSNALFFVQVALATSVTSHCLVYIGVVGISKSSFAIVISSILLTLLLYPLYPDKTHRFLSPLSTLAILCFWIMENKALDFLNLLLLFEMMGTFLLFTEPRVPSSYRSLAYAFAVSLPLTLMLILLFDPIHLFYFPRFINYPWLIAKLILAGSLIWICQWIVGGWRQLLREPIRSAVIAILVLGFISSPGILLTLALLVLGYALRDRFLCAIALVFFPVFLITYYYNLDIDLGTKSYILMGSGVVLFLICWLFNRFKSSIRTAEMTVPIEPTKRDYMTWSAIAIMIFILSIYNGLIIQKENTLKTGQQVFLRLAPRDPRSIMQGDYMVLNYEILRELNNKFTDRTIDDGKLVIRLDEKRIASFVRLYHNEPLNPGEHLLRYRKRGQYRLGAESFLFQEGKAALYQPARYGELRVDGSGNAVLVGLRGENLEILGISEVPEQK